MPRSRLGVVLLLPEPVATEVDGLRRGLGDGALGRVAAHVTLVPPVNVSDDGFDEALDLLRRAAAGAAPLTLTLGPPATFWPVTPVVYLAVGGDVAALRRLRDEVFAPPLARPLTHDWVPHATLCDGLPEDRIAPALAALADYAAVVRIDRVHLLREEPGRVWRPVADVALGPPAVVGRGGIELELGVSDVVPDGVRRRLGAPTRFAVTARHHDVVVGLAEITVQGSAAHLDHLEVADGHRGTGVGSRLLAAALSHAADLGCTDMVAAAAAPPGAGPGPGVGFLRHRGFAADAAAPGVLRRAL